jgi:hypothetical protein
VVWQQVGKCKHIDSAFTENLAGFSSANLQPDCGLILKALCSTLLLAYPAVSTLAKARGKKNGGDLCMTSRGGCGRGILQWERPSFQRYRYW